MRRVRGLAAATAALAVVALTPVAALADQAQDYNLFVLGNMNMSSSDVEGRVAVGGNATLGSYSVGADASASTVNLVVGGNLTAHGGSTKGGTIVGGTTNYQNWSTAGLQPAGTALPVNFAAEATRLGQVSTLLSNYTPNGTVYVPPWGGQYTLTGASSGLSVFDISGSQLSHTNTLTINLTPGTFAVINVNGTADSFSNAGITINGGNASDVLWNFSDATTLSFSGISMQGSVLAPDAAYLGGWGQLNGELIVNSFSDTLGATQINDGNPFAGNLLGLDPAPPHVPGVPEPAVWALMILGFGFTGAALRRRRAAFAAA
ncbi:choice-of-anchor A family protein [Phenylobacterium sp.]|uniref:choice-of-anchor A family protein n=1 Tax=Phenylobacterium sp. TaxID=1871053 RepID=UPI00122B80A0|nr:choice-of-anchor A family protein [Phenylobacterium sp.]THD57922.1 MAG: choice-of-anchor A family protein [Phenylobacterium sp.]